MPETKNTDCNAAARHTPGPWVVCKDGVSVGSTCGLICTTGLPSQHEDQAHNELRANAHLIASAPAMLDALHALRKEVIVYAHQRPEDSRLWGAFERASIAIAKAEGRA